MYAEFEYMQPTDLHQCCDFLKAESANAVVYNGGTDLLVQLRAKKLSPHTLVDIKGIPDCQGIAVVDGFLRIGAAAPFALIANHALVQQYAPALAEAAKKVGSVLIRNKATLAGNIQNASPAADGLVAAWGLGAELVLVSSRGERRIQLDEFIVGPRKTKLAVDEIILSINIPIKKWNYTEFFKVGRRNALAISVVNGLVALDFKPGSWEIANSHIVLGSVAPTPLRIYEAEKLLVGKCYSDVLAEELARVISSTISPISDIRASAKYRSYIASMMVCRQIEEACKEVKLC